MDETTTEQTRSATLVAMLLRGVVPARGPLVLGVRIVGAALLLGTGWIHQHLDDIGYSTVPTIGPLFRIDAVLALVCALAVLAVPMPWWRVACAAGALLQIGTLGGLVMSLTVGVLGFRETLDAPDVPQAVIVETLGFVVLVVGALVRPSPSTAAARDDRGREVPHGHAHG